ncbi:MAG: putative bifunctional diguanylate cyclase/phosphodiesterase [Cellvibrionaceae bacterium]
MLTLKSKNSELNARINRTLATLMYEQGISGIIVNFLVSCALLFVVYKGNPFLIYWGIAMGTTLIFRLIDIISWKTYVAKSNFNGSHYIFRYSLGTFISGIGWATLPFISFSALSSIELAIVTAIFSGLAGGSTTVLAASRTLVLTYITCVLLIPSICLLITPQEFSSILGALGIMYAFVMYSSASKASSYTYSAAKLHHQNQDLLDEVGYEKDQVELSNKKLHQAYLDINKANEDLEHQVLERTEKLNQLASTDELTGLKNRHTFVEILNEAVFNAVHNEKPFSVLFIDLDGFKEINDIHGHLIGDSVLKTVTQRLKHCLKNTDFLCRWGGDEFVLIVDDTDPSVLLNIGKRIGQHLSQIIDLDDSIIEIGSSIGIATCPRHGRTTTELLNAADIAMYHLKNGKKGGCIMFENTFLDTARKEQRLREGLKNAIQNNELTLHYQAIVPTRPEDPIIYEALMRWEFEGEKIPPNVFIQVAENSGSISALGDWAIMKVCGDLASGVLGHNANIAVNISVKQILEENIVDTVSRAIMQYNIDPRKLHLEITESFFASNLTFVANVLTQLRQLGVNISIDDFGTGYSSLSYLQALPVDIVKIDRSFIKNLDQGNKSIITATISIARTFDCKVIAEGIENPQQRDALLSLGVDYLQGFYFSKPSMIDNVKENIHNNENLRLRVISPTVLPKR